MSTPGIWELLLILGIVLLLFGTKKLKTLGSDLGSAIKGFKKAVSTDESAKAGPSAETDSDTTDSDTESTDSKESIIGADSTNHQT